MCHIINIRATELASELKQLTAIIVKGEEPACACTNALKSVWDLVPRDSHNLPLVYQHPGLADAVIKVLGYDEGEGRIFSCGILWYISRCDDIKREMFQHPGLVDVLLKVAKEDNGDARV